MSEWIDDTWLEFAIDEMLEEFLKNHSQTMPENPLNVWKETELGYFCFAFTLWAAQSKFKMKNANIFNERVEEYHENLKASMKDSDQENYSAYEIREKEYLALLTKGASSLFGAISGSPFKPACKALVENACKRYIFSAKDLVNIIHPWLIEKGMAFDQRINIK